MIKEAFNKGIARGLKEYEKKAPDESLKALAKIKTIIETYEKVGYHIDYELGEIIEEIELILDKKNNHIETFKNDARLGIIKDLIKESFEKMGRTGTNSDGNALSILVRKINNYLKNIEIPNNYMVIARLKNEKYY